MATLASILKRRLINLGWSPEMAAKGVKASGGNGWWLAPVARIADKAEWMAARRKLVDVIPAGTKIHGAGGFAEFDGKNFVRDGKVFLALGLASVIEELFNDSHDRSRGHAQIERVEFAA